MIEKQLSNEERDALIAQGWTPPKPVNPDWKEAEKLRDDWENDDLDEIIDVALAGIKRGRALERAEAKPGMVWKEHDGSVKSPVFIADYVWIKNRQGTCVCHTSSVAWSHVTHYAITTQPEEK
jgi:hypothetical protein